MFFFIRSASPRWDERGLCSDILGYRRNIFESSFYWRRHFRAFLYSFLNSEFRGRRSSLWVRTVTLLAPRIGNDGSYVTRSIREVHFAWQAQYLVSLKGDCVCSTHWKWRFICDADPSWGSFCVAGAVFWWSWRVALVAPRVGNDVSNVTRIHHEIHFAWQAQCLVKLEGAFCCSAHCKWRCICVKDQSRELLCSTECWTRVVRYNPL